MMICSTLLVGITTVECLTVTKRNQWEVTCSESDECKTARESLVAIFRVGMHSG